MNMTITPNQNEDLTDTIRQTTRDVEGDVITIGHIVRQFQYRGFGPLLLVPSIIVILPTGAIPMVPALCGLFLLFVCFQIVLGRAHPWIPERLGRASVSKTAFESGTQKIMPLTRKIDRVVNERLSFMTSEPVKRLAATICMVLCLIMVLTGFIPMLPDVLVLPMIAFGLGFIARDGVLIALGFVMTLGSFYGAAHMLGIMSG